MIDALTIASSGLSANQAWINSISHNIANMQTVGFKRGQVSFHDLVRVEPAAGAGAAALTAVGAGIQAGAPTQLFTPGAMNQTGNALDVAIQGDGLFEVNLASGEQAYTRAGRLHVAADGQLALPTGQALTSDVRIPPDAMQVQVASNGQVQARLSSGEVMQVGQIRLSRFANPDALLARGDGLYSQTAGSGEVQYADPGQQGAGVLLASYLEMSNVDMVQEMGDLMMAQRAYQLNARVLQASDQIMETLNNLRRA